MSREYPERPIIGVGAVIIEEERVLLIKRGQAPLKGSGRCRAARSSWAKHCKRAFAAKCSKRRG